MRERPKSPQLMRGPLGSNKHLEAFWNQNSAIDYTLTMNSPGLSRSSPTYGICSPKSSRITLIY